MIGVIADDITGSNDIGVMFSKSGYRSDIYSYQPAVLDQLLEENPDVLIFDTDSRLDRKETAYQKVFQATKDMQKAGAVQFYNKTCSVFRGNIGAEFDAMLDALQEEFAVVVLGFPKNGRITVESTHFVHGEKLEDSPFRKDPVHPMTESNLVQILQSQTRRKVTAIHHPFIRQGADRIKEKIKAIKDAGETQYVILDVTDQKDLKEIAKAVYQEKVICGSSALAEEIPGQRPKQRKRENTLPLPVSSGEKGLFCAVGSLTPQTYQQIEYMKKSDSIVLELDTLSLMKRDNGNQENMRLLEQVVEQVNKGRNVVFHTSNTTEKVKATKQAGLERGWDNTEISRFISETMADITCKTIEETGQHRFMIAGGDTSAAACRRLGIRGMRVWEEIQPGLPSCLSHTIPPYLFVLKSGSFGSPGFLEKAFAHLLRQHPAGSEKL